MIKINHSKYLELFTFLPNMDMSLSGWDWKLHYFLGFPYIIYTK